MTIDDMKILERNHEKAVQDVQNLAVNIVDFLMSGGSLTTAQMLAYRDAKKNVMRIKRDLAKAMVWYKENVSRNIAYTDDPITPVDLSVYVSDVMRERYRNPEHTTRDIFQGDELGAKHVKRLVGGGYLRKIIDGSNFNLPSAKQWAVSFHSFPGNGAE